jgi:hypothetical protein
MKSYAPLVLASPAEIEISLTTPQPYHDGLYNDQKELSLLPT